MSRLATSRTVPWSPSRNGLLAAAAALLIVLVAAWTVHREFTRQRAESTARLGALSELRATQVHAWLDRQLGVARYMADSYGQAALYDRWQDLGDAQAGGRLLERAVASRRANDADRVLLVQANGQVLAREFPDNTPESPELQATLARAIAGGQVEFSRFYRPGDARQPLRMDVVVPLVKTGTPAHGALVLRVSPERSLFPLLNTWPVPSATGESVLWATQGDRAVNISETRFPLTEAGRASTLLATGRSAIAMATRGEIADGQPVTTTDYRGERVICVARVVAGTDWRLVSKIDLAEVDAPSWREARWMIAVAALALLGVALASGLWRQRGVIASGMETQREQRERLQALALLEAIAESANDAIVAKDLDGRFVFCNRAAWQRIGRTREDVIGATNADLFPPETAALIDEHEAEVKASAQARVFEERLWTRRGDVQVVVSRGPMFDHEGRLIGLLGVSRDVTESRSVQRALDESEARYRSVFAVLHEGIFVCDVEGRVVSCNPAAERIIGLPVEQWTRDFGPPGWIAIRPDGSRMSPRELPAARVLAGEGALRDVMHRALSPGGEMRFFEISAVPVASPGTGALTAVVISFADVTLREQQREELERHRHQLAAMVAERTAALETANVALAHSRDEAESATRAKSAFLANMSHEIRTPMNAIIGMTHLLARQARDGQQRERLSKIDDAAQHLLQIINNVLDLSKIEAGKLVLEQADFAVESLVARSFEMVDERAAEKGLALSSDMTRLPAMLRGDATRLSQMLINLLSNAVEYTLRGRVRLEGAVVAEDGDRLQVRFSVHDTGEGISVERQARLFNAFEQADSSMTRRHGGSGLGLALTRQLAEAMGGDTGLTSRLGVGSTFWFTAWLGPSAAAASVVPPRFAGRRVLLVDDEPASRAGVRACLEALGFEVEEAAAGAAPRCAEAALAAGRPHDAVLIDGDVNLGDGAEGAMSTLVDLRSLLGDALPPAMLLTASQALDVWGAARNAGFESVLLKPTSEAALEAALAQALQLGNPTAKPVASAPVVNEALLLDRHRGQRVLLAEDNAVNREVAEAMLRGAGLVVETAGDGAEALRAVLTRPYDLVLMDMQMPTLDGLEATRRLRQRIGRGLPVIAMTANAFSEDRAACLAAGMDDHVAKPVVPAQLYGVLLRWLPARAGYAEAVPEPAAPATPAVVNLPQPVAIEPFLDRLRGLGGLDVETAVDNLGGRAEILPRVLRRFVETYRGGEPALAEADSPGLRGRWRNACHSLRGAGATIGATAIADDALALERDIDEGVASGDLQPRAQALDAALRALSGRLAELL